jgi:hypothetical protein
MAQNAFLWIKDNGEVSWCGVEHGDAKIHHVFFPDGKLYVAIKFAGRKYWRGIGIEQGYAGAEIRIFELTSCMGNKRYRAKELYSIPVRNEHGDTLVGKIRAEMGE